METTHSDESNDEPNSKRPKMETEGATSSKPKSIDPFLSLPPDVLAKIIGYTSIAQWAALESLDTNFRAATWIAWRQLRSINVDREFLMKYETVDGRSSAVNSVGMVLEKLAERSPFLTSLSGIAELNSDTAVSLAKFEQLQSISLGDAKFINDYRRRPPIKLEAVVEFLESTRSRTSLKELQLFNAIDRHECGYATIQDRFAASFVNGREIQLPLKLETYASDCFVPWNTMDTSRLTELRIGKARIEPEQLTRLIERATNLRQIELSFGYCRNKTHGQCNGRRLEANKKLLTALAAHEGLTAIRFGVRFWCDRPCTNFESEFIDMLKSIGRRGQLRKLSLETPEHVSIAVNMNDVCATIRDHIPYLRSIKLNIDGLTEESVCGIVSLPELEEVQFTDEYQTPPKMTDAIKKIAQLPQLKRLAFNVIREEDSNSLECLSTATALTDLRIRHACWISADILDKWSTGFASNLEILMLTSWTEVDENGFVRFLEKAVRLRVLLLDGRITDRSLMAIVQSCPELEVFGLRSSSKEITVQRLQEIVDRCPRLKRLEIGEEYCKVGGIGGEVRNKLRFPKYRKINEVDLEFLKYDFDDYEED